MSKTALIDALRACDNNRTKLADRLQVKRQQIQQWLKTDTGAPRWYRDAVLKIAKEVRK